MNATLTAVLMAGGESRRMGTDKATLFYEGRPLWYRQWNLLRALQPENLFISARSQPSWCPANAIVVLDEPPSHGPLSGLVAALKHLRTTHLLALAVDLPHMTVDHLHSLRASVGLSQGVVPQQDDYFEPLCAVYPAESLALAAQSLATGQFSLQSLVNTLISQKLLQPRRLQPVELPLYHNTNHPEDLEPGR